MAKLNKQEINAIASKTLRMITENAENAKLEAIKNYQPSDNYMKFRNYLNRIKVINNQLKELNNEFSTLVSNINNLEYDYYMTHQLREIEDDLTITKFLGKIIVKEVKMPKIPTIEELKEDITIAAIDEDFDAAKVIDNLIEKYK